MNVPPPVPEGESMPDPALSDFNTELACALDELGRRVRPREFDPHAILRRTARRRTGRMLASAAAALAAVAGVTAFAVRPGGAAVTIAAHGGTPSVAVLVGTGVDPLVVPGVFRTTPNGAAVSGFAQFGATTVAVALQPTNGDANARMVQTGWSVNGVEMTAQVWFSDTPQTRPQTAPGDPAGTVVGTVNGHPAYEADRPQRQLAFWAGSPGYATATIFKNGMLDQSATAAELLTVAKSLEVGPVQVPMPLSIAGLDSAKVTSAEVTGGISPVQKFAWSASFSVVIDGRGYQITAHPGPAVTPTPTGGTTTTGLASAVETLDGLGIEVSTDSAKQGSPQAPSAAQVLAHITSLGANPSGWTTNVIVK